MGLALSRNTAMGCGGALLFIVGCIVSIVWLLMGSVATELDLQSGRQKHIWRIGPVELRSKVIDTPASELLLQMDDRALPEKWIVIDIQHPLSNERVNYVGSGGALVLDQMVRMCRRYNVEEESAARGVRKALELMKGWDEPELIVDSDKGKLELRSKKTGKPLWESGGGTS